MSAIARYYKFKGCNVSGYDKTESELTEELIAEGIGVHYEDNTDFIPKDVENTLVVYTPAIPHDLKELVYVQEHGYDSYEKLSETADAIYTKMAKARGDAKLTESKLRKTNEQIHYLGQYLSAKSIYGEFLKTPNKKIFRQAHSDELAQYEEALQILKQHSPDGKFPTMKDLRAEKEQLTIQKDAQYDTYHYFKDYHKELQTVCANVDSILGTEQEVQQHEQQHTRKYEPSL